MKRDERTIMLENAYKLLQETRSLRLFVFIDTAQDYKWLKGSKIGSKDGVVAVVPVDVSAPSGGRPLTIKSWSGNQSRFSRIKYAFLHGVLQGFITTEDRIVCVLGPWGKSRLDTITVHDLALSWTEEFPFDPRAVISHKAFHTILAVIDIALDLGALGREGKSIGTTFVIGDAENTLKLSHQAVFNAFKGYPRDERLINRPEVVESVKELAQLDGAIIIGDDGVVEAAGRHLDAKSEVTKALRGHGSRHRAAAGISKATKAVSVVVSESTGKVTIFQNGKIITTLEPVISRRLV